MKSSINRKAVIVGMFIFIGICFLTVGILKVGSLHKSFSKKIVVSTVFDDVNGLIPGNNIWFSGVKVGTVEKISFVGHSKVQVDMNIDVKAKEFIRIDAHVKISSDGFIGNKIIVISGGTNNVRAVQNGDSLTVEKSLSTDDVMKSLQQNNINILDITSDLKNISKQISEGQGTIGKILMNDSLYYSMMKSVEIIQQAAKNAEVITASLSDFAVKLNKEGNLANDIVTDTTIFKSLKSSAAQINQIAGTANGVAVNLKQATDNLNNDSTLLGVLLSDRDAAINLKSILRNLDSSSQKLDEDLKAVQHNFLLRRYFKNKEKQE